LHRELFCIHVGVCTVANFVLKSALLCGVIKLLINLSVIVLDDKTDTVNVLFDVTEFVNE